MYSHALARVYLAVAIAWIASASAAQSLRFFTWNVAGAVRDAAVVDSSVADLISEVGLGDILFLQEVIDMNQVAAVDDFDDESVTTASGGAYQGSDHLAVVAERERISDGRTPMAIVRGFRARIDELEGKVTA